MKRKVYLLSFCILLLIAIFNGILFYSANFSAEYMQSKNVWGDTQAVRLSDYQRQAHILALLPKDPGEAEVMTEKLLRYLDNQRQIQDTVMSKWRVEELSKPPEGISGTSLFKELQDSDIQNYGRLLTLIRGVNHYKDYLANVNDNADGVISLLYPLGNAEENYNNALQCKRDFAGLDTLVLVPALDNGINLVLHYHVTDFLAFLLLCSISALFYVYLKRQTLLMAEGIHSIGRPLFCFSAVGTLSLYLTNLLIAKHVLGLPSLQIPLQSLEGFYTCPYKITLGGFLLFWLVLKLCTMLFVLFLLFLAISAKKPIFTALPVLLFLGVEMLLSRIPVSQIGMDLPREINLFSGLTSERFFDRYLNITIHAQALPRIWLFLICFTIPFVILCFLSLQRLSAYWEHARTQLQKVYSEEIDKRYQETRRLWHDFNNHLLTIKALYATGHEKEAEDYIEKLSDESQKRLLPAKTGSNAVDLLLFQKSQVSREKNAEIRYVISCDLKKHGFRDYDLCSLLGNILDNALEACESVTDKTPQIKLRMEERGNMLFVSCENEFRGERSQKGDQFLTTKKDSDHHGLGLQSIKQICNKYGGTMDTLIQGDTFRITLLLNDKKS